MRQVIVRGTGNNLSALFASTNISRIFNVARLTSTALSRGNESFSPIFEMKLLNAAVFVKHRPRRWEQPEGKRIGRLKDVTKIVIPLDPTNLSAGARTFLVDGRNADRVVASIEGYAGDEPKYPRDIEIVQALSRAANFDPFFLRESLRKAGIDIDDIYSELPDDTVTGVTSFVVGEIEAIVSSAYTGSATDGAAARMANKIMSEANSVLLDPLRIAFQIEEGAFVESVYGWRGFLYYKYMHNHQRGRLQTTLREMLEHHRRQYVHPAERESVTAIVHAILNQSEKYYADCERIIAIYETAYSKLVNDKSPAEFGRFLRVAKSYFESLGLRVGVIEHFLTFWDLVRPVNGKSIYAHHTDMVLDLRDSLGL